MKRYWFVGAMTCAALLMIWSASAYSQQAGEPAKKSEMAAPQETGGAKPGGETAKQSGKEDQKSLKAEAKKSIKELDKQIVSLGKEVKKQGANVKAEAKESWKDLKVKQKEAKKQLKALHKAGGKTWNKAKSDFDAALDELRKAYDKAASQFK